MGADDRNPAPHPRLALHTAEPTVFGHGFISGLMSAILGLTGLGLVIALRFPALAVPELRSLRSFVYLQAVVHVVLVTAFLLGTVSAWLRTNKTLALVGILCTLIHQARD